MAWSIGSHKANGAHPWKGSQVGPTQDQVRTTTQLVSTMKISQFFKASHNRVIDRRGRLKLTLVRQVKVTALASWWSNQLQILENKLIPCKLSKENKMQIECNRVLIHLMYSFQTLISRTRHSQKASLSSILSSSSRIFWLSYPISFRKTTSFCWVQRRAPS